MYNVATNKLECRYCRIELKPFGGRFTPRFGHIPEVWLCIHCGYTIDMQEGINEALIVRGALNRRNERSRRYVAAQNGYRHNGYHGFDAGSVASGQIRQKVLELLFVLLADRPEIQ